MSRVPAPAAAVLALLLGLTACSGDDPAAAPPAAEPTPLADFATDSLTVARESFCARVAPTAVEDALAGEPTDTEEWVDGDRAVVAPGVRDVVHEDGCRWRSPDGTTASGWVFTPPVTPARAAGLRRAAAQADGCRPITGAPAYGSPSVAVRCRDGSTTFSGLFGDAWLSCSLTAAQPPGIERVGRWCVALAQAATA